MNIYRADLHTHTVLSPCADIEMSAGNIVEAALEKRIDILGITDHNSTLNALLVKRLAADEGILVLTGAEVTTREEIHCLAFFEFENELADFQSWIEENITRVPNSPSRFGHQVVIDEDENIIDEVEYLLIMALSKTIDQVEARVHELNGLFIPAHVDRPVNGLLSQLGFFPPGIKYDAIELYSHGRYEDLLRHHPVMSRVPLIRSSDSHYLNQIGKSHTGFMMNELSFNEVRSALRGEGGRKVSIS